VDPSTHRAGSIHTHTGTALADLCAVYYAPVHSYIARTAHDLGDARDLTQEFFARLLAGRVIGDADREKGRFRGYLLGAVKHHLADTRDRLRAVTRFITINFDADAVLLVNFCTRGKGTQQFKHWQRLGVIRRFMPIL
jgi:DNA-directed RNA polymerase specialized sigma24 family protein